MSLVPGHLVTRGRRLSVAAGALAVTVVLGGGAALAAVPSTTTGRFTGCVAGSDGRLRVIDAQAGKHCRHGEHRISWSKGWTHRGAWGAGVRYTVGGVVTEDGSSYVARRTSRGLRPSVSPAEWGLVARAGAPAPGGTGGSSPATVRYTTDSGTAAAGHFGSATAYCPDGYSVTGGSVDWPMVLTTSPPRVEITQVPVDTDLDSDSVPNNGWRVNVLNAEATGDFGFTVHAVCASAVPAG
jgi:hypothetical protein